MKYRSGSQFREALDAHLRHHSRTAGVSAERLRKEIVFDRLLARLVAVAPDRWILKGGVALDHRLGDRARMTKDLDIGRWDTLDAATTDLQEAAAHDLGDYFSYTVRLTDGLAGLRDEGVAARYRIDALLGGRVFERVVLDVGFSVAPAIDYVAGRNLLVFAGVESVAFPTLPLPLHLAEKVHVYTRVYGDEGRPSTRVKDLVDMVLIATTSVLAADACTSALHAVFDSRATHPLPALLPPPPGLWAQPYAGLARAVGLDPLLTQGYAQAAAIVTPLLGLDAPASAMWNPLQRVWR